MEIYLKFVNVAKEKMAGLNEFDSEDVAYKVVKDMRAMHDQICVELHQKGEREEIVAHVSAYEKAKKEIMPERKKGKRHIIRAENVYDDDDAPTSHILSF